MKIRRLLMISALASLHFAAPASAQDYAQWRVPLGPIVEAQRTPSGVYFTLWSPKALGVRLLIYRGEESTSHQMHVTTGGRWALCLPNDQVPEGTQYAFVVRDENGEWQQPTPGIFALAVGTNGQRAALIDMRSTDPDGWDQDVRPSAGMDMSKAVIYEMHHRDFSIHPTSGIDHKGKFLALTEHGTQCDGERTGIDHLVDLGVTHVHLLPSYDFGSVDESRLDVPQYNWGYDPVNYNVPEGSYSTDPADPAVRIREFKQMVQALHSSGIRVVMDVVYNHVFDLGSSNFQRTAPGYFFRWNEDGTPANASGCGNETASERPMMRKFMLESILYWVREYHIDGFRFDLMGIHDQGTMSEIRETLNSIDPSIIIYGEGWAAGTPALDDDLLAMKSHVGRLPGVAAFGDELRDGLRGPWDGDEKGAFLIGNPGHEESIKFGLAGACLHPQVDMQQVNYSKHAWAADPSQMISYVSCHDDMCLADRIQCTLASQKVSGKKASVTMAERERLQKLAYAAVMTSRGVPFIWCGDEIMRDRKGVHNCYNSPDSINAIDWRLKAKHRDVYQYIRSLIALRKQYQWQQHDITFLPVSGSCIVAYQLGEGIAVVLNSNRRTITQPLPQGEWTLLSASEGNPRIKKASVSVPAQSAVILIKQ